MKSESSQHDVEQKYKAEREKRLRSDGIKQYRTVNDETLQGFLADPWSDNEKKRAPVDREAEVLILGGGFGGMLAAVRLIQAGVKDVLIVDKAADFGGAWYWNRYPGVACDIESYIYMPLLEELDFMPSEKYAKGPEIRSYAQKVGNKFGLYDRAVFQAEVNAIDWDSSKSRWIAKTKQGDRIQAKFFISAGGTLHSPKFPSLKGIETFKGPSFHTARWDYESTGGNVEGGMHKLKGKRVGVIGSGASSIQILPHLSEYAKEVTLFQRTPSSVLARMDAPTEKKFAAQMQRTPGWQKRRIENFNIIVSGGEQEEDLVQDSWTETMHNLPHWGGRADEKNMDDNMEKQDQADRRMMDQIRARVSEHVDDEETAEKLKPWYKLFCKRPCFNNDYLPTFNNRNVSLVDTSEKPKSQYVDEDGLWIAGKHYDLDLIIYATGFEVGSDFCQRLGATICGENGITLTKKWEDGTSTLHGLYTHGFPNAFFMLMAQSGYTQNNTHALTEQAGQIAYIIKEVVERKINTIQPSKQAETQWVDTIVELAKTQYKFVADCTPGYYTMEGADKNKWLRDASYGKGSPAYFELLDTWRRNGKLEGLNHFGVKMIDHENGKRSFKCSSYHFSNLVFQQMNDGRQDDHVRAGNYEKDIE
ncbi:phenylacetone monooxygenase [Tothia fuscella]|uniref:Phenylacetone monooxygenase n=1 Tax=Tothia fuscella TaxID=1048955 RepID=A0A9P4NDX5_9PEZI|nr:phenylacetone monooxygenase [Tothia fuscella]